MMISLRESMEYLAGQRDEPPAVIGRITPWIARSVVWIISIIFIYALCGQSSKFIYIDF